MRPFVSPTIIDQLDRGQRHWRAVLASPAKHWKSVAALVAAILVLGTVSLDVASFGRTLSACRSVEVLCDDAAGTRCDRVYDGCPGTYGEYVAGNPLSGLMLPRIRGWSVVDYGAWALQLLYKLVWGSVFFLLYVAVQPLFLNPPVWLALGLAGRMLLRKMKEEPQSMLSFVDSQKAFGDARPAKRAAIHLALLGKDNLVTQEFED